MSSRLDIDADGLTPRQHNAIVKLVAGTAIKTVAKAVGVAEKTLHEWLKEPAFKREFRRARQVVIDLALTQLGQLTKDAVAALRKNLKCKIPAVEVRAATAVLDKAINGQAMSDMAAEIAELREMLGRADADARGGEGGTPAAPGGGGTPLPPGGGVDPRPPAGGPDAADGGGGAHPGPVAGGVDPVPGSADRGPLHSPGGEESDGGGPGAGPLLD